MMHKNIAVPIEGYRAFFLSQATSLERLLFAPNDTFSCFQTTRRELIEALKEYSQTQPEEVCVFYNPQTQTVYKPPQATVSSPGSWTGVFLGAPLFENYHLRPCVIMHTHPRQAVIKLIVGRLLEPTTQRILFPEQSPDFSQSLENLIANVMSAVGSILISVHLPSPNDYLIGTVPDGKELAVVSDWGGPVYFKQIHGNPSFEADIRQILPSSLDDFYKDFFKEDKVSDGLVAILEKTNLPLLLNQNPKEQEIFYNSFCNLCLDHLNLKFIESKFNQAFSPQGCSISSIPRGDTPVSLHVIPTESKQKEIMGKVLVALILTVFFGIFVNTLSPVDY